MPYATSHRVVSPSAVLTAKSMVRAASTSGNNVGLFECMGLNDKDAQVINDLDSVSRAIEAAFSEMHDVNERLHVQVTAGAPAPIL